MEVVTDGPTTQVALSGDFDMQATFTVEPTLEQALEEPGLERLVVDLSRLEFIDSTGIGVLLRVREETTRRAIDFSIVPGPTQVQRVFETTGLDTVLPFQSA